MSKTKQAGHDAVAGPVEPTVRPHPLDDEHPYTYTSTQATNCAGCGEYKHTPLRIDAMGGHVCLTCIDRKLGTLLGEFGYPAPQKPLTEMQIQEVCCAVDASGERRVKNRQYEHDAMELGRELYEGAVNQLLPQDLAPLRAMVEAAYTKAAQLRANETRDDRDDFPGDYEV